MTKNRDVDPIVSPDWLHEHLTDDGLSIVDVRGPSTFREEHVPGSVNAPKWKWADNEAEFLMTLPDDDTLRSLVGDLGIADGDTVVVLGGTGGAFELADPVNVADTLIYAGLEDVAVLDGGFAAWADGRPTETGEVSPDSVTFEGDPDESMFVSKTEVASRDDDVVLVDARTPEAYFGTIQEEFTHRPGHIPGATLLPTPWIWTEDGRVRDLEDLEAMVEGVVGPDRSADVMLYCGASPFSKAWRFLLQEALGYENPNVYLNAAEEWTKDPEAPLNRYCWE